MSEYQNKKADRVSMIGPRARKTRSRILASMRKLLDEKEYIAITTAELAQRAEVNEGLIYHYFKSKDDVFWSVLEEYMHDYLRFVTLHTQGIKGTLNMIRKFIWANIYFLIKEHPGGKILLLEVRSNPKYYDTTAFALTARNREIVLEIIQKGISSGEISKSINPYGLASIIIGSLEHAVLPIISHKKKRDLEELTEAICNIIFGGICEKDDAMTRLIKKVDALEKAVKGLGHTT